MNFFELSFLGALQGLTEFLPISSSGHLFLAQKFLNIPPSLPLEIWLHVASLLAVIIFYWAEILEILKKLFDKNDTEKIGWKLLLATICTFPFAILGKKILDVDLSVSFVGITLICTAGFLLVAEKFRPKKEVNFSWVLAAFLGLVQGISILPGISRSGITIAFLILVGLNRQKAAKYSFLLSIPTILGGFIFTLKDAETIPALSAELLVGLVVAFTLSVISIKWMTKLVEKKWIWFVPYCAILGFILLFL